jgi:hypothetical protein
MANVSSEGPEAFETDFWKDANLRKSWDDIVRVTVTVHSTALRLRQVKCAVTVIPGIVPAMGDT